MRIGSPSSTRALAGERAVAGPVAAVDVDPLRGRDRVDIALGVDQRATPGAPLDLEHGQSVRPTGVVGLDRLHLLLRLREALRADAAADPEPDPEGLLAPGVGVVPADQVGGAHQGGGTLELLRGEQAQRVPHQDGDTAAAVERTVVGGERSLESADREGERREPEVGLGLAATGREEEQLDPGGIAAAVRVAGIDEGRQLHQDEGQLERPPGGGRVALGFDVGDGGLDRDVSGGGSRRGDLGADPLIAHRAVHEVERAQRVWRRSPGEPARSPAGWPSRALRAIASLAVSWRCAGSSAAFDSWPCSQES